MQPPVTALGKGLKVEWVDFYGDHTMHACLSDEPGQRIEICIDGRKNSPLVTDYSSKPGTRTRQGLRWSNWVLPRKES
jgi:hypothetical protein